MNLERKYLAFNSIVSSTQNILYIYNAEKKEIEFLNPMAAVQVDIIKKEESKISIENFIEKIHPQDRLKYLSQIDGVLSGREKKEKPIEYRLLRKNGDVFWISDTLILLKIEDAESKEIVGFASNITNVRRKEEKYQNEEIRLRAILENAREQYYFIGVDYKVQSLNKNAKDFLIKSYNRNIFEGYSILEFLPLENPNTFTEKFNYALNGTAIQYETQIKDEKGETNWFQFSYVPVRNKTNQITNICFIIVDITEIRKATKNLMDLNQELEDRVKERTRELLEEVAQRRITESLLQKSLIKEKELNELKSKFIAMVSHQFKTPMTTISMSTQMLENYFEKQSEVKRRRHYSKIKEATQSLNRLIEGILSVSRSESSSMPFDPSKVDVPTFLHELIGNFQSNHPDYRFEIRFEKKNKTEYNIDSNIISHILENLLTNAVKYSPVNTTIYITAVLEEKSLLFIVKDNGLGIPKEDQDRIFETFYRGKNVANISGTGLGLNIVKNLVELHLGKINFKSSESEGTEFLIWIPDIVENADGNNFNH